MPADALSTVADMGHLGRALQRRSGQVAARMAALAAGAGHRLDDLAEQRAAVAGEAATGCVGRWLAEGGRAPTADPARECAQLFAGLAEACVAPLSEITERCLLWRDAVGEAVHEIAAASSLQAHARARALVLLRACLNAALLRVCECFESAQAMAEQERGRGAELQAQVRAALAGAQLRLVYQPVFSLGDQIVPTGVEALLRWQHPDRGALSPADFIPELERTGLIVEVGRFVLSEACAQCAAWHAAGLPVNVGVNVSARQLDDLRLIEDVRLALSRSGLVAHALVIEVTETAAMRDVELSTRVLRALKDTGVRVAIDDFGTGYSSLAHLQELPIDTLKIDRSFIARGSRGEESEVLLRALAQLGASLRLTTLAEGIETLAQLELLRELGCQKGQGFLLSRPLAVEMVAPFLRERMRLGVADAAAG